VHIQRLTVSGLRGLRDVEITLGERMTMLLGDNGAGKSTLAGAISYALRGWCEWTTRAGADAAGLIRNAEGTAQIELQTDSGAIVRKIKASGASVEFGGEKGVKAAGAAIANVLPPAAVTDCMLSAGEFLRLDGKRQQDILFALTGGGDVDAAWVRERLTAEQVALLGKELTTLRTGSELMTTLHKAAYDARTAANAALSTLKAQAAEAPTAPSNLDALRSAATDAGKAYMEASSASKAAETLQRAHDAAAARAQEATSRQMRAAQELEAYAKPTVARPTDKELEAAHKAVADAQAAVNAADTECLAQREALSGLRGQINTLEPQIDRFGSATQGACLVLSTLACPLTADEREAALAQARADLAALREQETAISELVAEALRSKNAAEAAETKATAAAQAADRAEASWSGYVQRRRDLERSAAQAGKDIEVAQRALDESPAPDTEALQAALTDADEAMQSAAASLRAAEQAQAAVDAYAKSTAGLEAAETKASALDELVGLLAPAGLQAEAMREQIGEILDAVNESLGAFSDYSIDAEPGEDFRVIVIHKGGRREARLLSRGEQFVVGCALQIAFARITGFDFVVIDGADQLDGHNRGPLLRMVYESGVQALVTAVPSETVPEGELPTMYPRAPGITTYWMAYGEEQLVAAIAEAGQDDEDGEGEAA